MNITLLLTVCLILLLNPLSAFANAAAISQQKKSYQAATPATLLHFNDAFVEVDKFYRDGPALRLCPPSRDTTVVMVEQGRCLERARGAFSNTSTVIADYSPQEFLDAAYGKGVVTLRGVSFVIPPRSSPIFAERHIVLFYSIN